MVCLLGMVGIWLGTGGWNPPFAYRTRDVPDREIVARVAFEYENEALTAEKQATAESRMRCIYRNDPARVLLVQDSVIEELFSILSSDYSPAKWREFFPEEALEEDIRPGFDTFKNELLSSDAQLLKTKNAVTGALKPIVNRGLLQKLQHEVFQGRSESISVYQGDDLDSMTEVQVSDVRILQLEKPLQESLKREFNEQGGFENVDLLVERIGYWIFSNFSETLKLDVENTKARRKRVRSEVPVEKKKYDVGDSLTYESSKIDKGRGIRAGQPLIESDIDILLAEQAAFVEQLTGSRKTMVALADFGLYTAVFLLCGAYMYLREPKIIREIGRFSMVTAAFVLAVVLACNFEDRWRVELVPLTVFSMVISIAYRHEIAWILGASASLVTVYSLGMDLNDFVIFVSAVTTGSFLCTEISSRTKLFYVGLLMALITFATSVGSGILSGQASTWSAVISNQFLLASWYGFCAFLSALLITVILPFIEKIFDVQTDLTLLEWSDPSHELLNKLIQRAPGTYNHSINVASIAETAADAIGANGLLCRVAAYFHDVGKMLKPEYFVENQTQGENRHDGLVPAMSSLVIIAHVKDGVELARKHKLPTSMIDLIEQHHGTTLVEYFYEQAVKEAREKGLDEEVDEATFRYPGPRPQTREACVMMLADAVESACRTLTEPAPARIEGLVNEITAKKLDDGQFAECPLTLEELDSIKRSLTKSLISVYHSRIKYPEQNGND